MRVLVAEDHTLLAGRIAQGLRQAGMAVDAVHDGAAALEAAAQAAYDVIVLDRDLPVVHGDRVCRTLAGGGPRILMLTAAAGVDDRVDGLELGADDYLPSRSRSPSSPPACGRYLAERRPRRLCCAAGTWPWTAPVTAPVAGPERCP
jgi:CheY-like chemotaxis protein